MYVRTQEMDLFDNLSSIANKKQEEIEKIIQETVDVIKEPLLDEAESFCFQSMLYFLIRLQCVTKYFICLRYRLSR
jgi:hypothetical protein